MIDYNVYSDTDALMLSIEPFILKHIPIEKWKSFDETKKIETIKKISFLVQSYVNKNMFEKTQLGTYNSNERDFKISFKAENIFKSSLFITKKKYAGLVKWKEGVYKDSISVKGLEIVRSDTPIIFRKALNEVLDLVLREGTDQDIFNLVSKYENLIYTLSPEDISTNIGVNNIKKYINLKTFEIPKHTPWHVKGAANYMYLMKKLRLTNKYPRIEEGIKAKTVYVKQNTYQIDVITFQKWPSEFQKYNILPDYNKMFEVHFLKKVQYLLKPMKRENFYNKTDSFDLFF